MLSPIYYEDGIYSPYKNRTCDINIITPDNYNIHVAELKTKFEDTITSKEKKNIRLMSKRRLNKFAVQKLLKSRGFVKDDEITYGALLLPDYNKSDGGIERNNNIIYEEKECIWTPIRNQPNIKVSNLIKNLESLEKQGCLKTPNRYLKMAFEDLKLTSTPMSVVLDNEFTFDNEKNLKQKEKLKKSRSTLIPILNYRIPSKESIFKKTGLKKLCKMSDKKNKDLRRMENCSTKLTKIIEYNKLTKKSKIPIMVNKKNNI